jgi:hypothetical protein
MQICGTHFAFTSLRRSDRKGNGDNHGMITMMMTEPTDGFYDNHVFFSKISLLLKQLREFSSDIRDT